MRCRTGYSHSNTLLADNPILFRYNRIGLHFAAVALHLLLTVSPAAAYEGDYSLKADIWLGLTFDGSGLQEQDMRIRAEHVLSYSWGELSVKQAVRTDDFLHELKQISLNLWFPDPVTVRIGRFSLPWSYGYTFHTADALHHSALEPWFDGAALIWAVSADWGITAAVRTDTVFTPGGSPRFGIQLNGFFLGIQTSLSSVFQINEMFCISGGLSVPAGPVVLHAEAAAELTGNADTETPAPLNQSLQPLQHDKKGIAVSCGINWQHWINSHGLSLILDYAYSDNPPQLSGKHLLMGQFGYEYDNLISSAHTLLTDLENRIMLYSLETGISPLDSLDFTAEAKFAADLKQTRPADIFLFHSASVGVRVYY